MAKIQWGNIEEINKFEELKKDDKFYIDYHIKIESEKDGIVYFNAPVDDLTINYFIGLIDKLVNDKRKKTITYKVNSPGGSISSMLNFIDHINRLRKTKGIKFISIGTGTIASAATGMCCIANERYLMPNAQAMIHELSTGRSGSFTHLNSYHEHIIDLHNRLVNLYVDNTVIEKIEGIDGIGVKRVREYKDFPLEKREDLFKKYAELMNKESWYNSNGYKDLGLIDKVL